MYDDDGGSIVSNSVRLIARLAGLRSLAPDGVAHAVGMGWVGGDATLAEGVRIFSGVDRNLWRDAAWSRTRSPWTPFQPAEATGHDDASDIICSINRGLARHLELFPETRCPITAGRDSRVIAALCHATGRDVRFYTRGSATDVDVILGARIAKSMGWTHEVIAEEEGDIAASWRELTEILIAQNDGMVSLWQLADANAQLSRATDDPLGYTLGGIGGETARRYYSRKEWTGPDIGRAQATQSLAAFLCKGSEQLLNPDGAELLRRMVTERLETLAAVGGEPEDLADSYYLYERVRRWGGCNARKVVAHMDTMAPLCFRPFLAAAFGGTVKHRKNERLHRSLVAHCSPRLYAMPFESGRWPTLGRIDALVRRVRGLFAPWHREPGSRRGEDVRRALMLSKLPEVRAEALDHRGSDFWSVVDRAKFETLSDPGHFRGLPPKELHRVMMAATTRHFENRLRANEL